MVSVYFRKQDSGSFNNKVVRFPSSLGCALTDTNSPEQDYKLITTQFTTLSFFIMTTKVMISLLDQGNTGAEILQILDTLTAEDSINEPTADSIEF